MKDDAISRQRVLKLLSTIPPEEAMTKAMLIQNVKYMSAAQPEKRTEERTETHARDLIDRQMAIDGFYEMASDMDYLCTVSDYVSFLESLPSAQPYTDEEIRRIQELEQAQFEKMYELGYQAGRMAQPERKRGKWIDDGDPFMWKCGCCGYRVKRYNNTRYCPNCGADMREVDDERPD